jgi:SNF2 family DNA or RNA helicase
MTTQTPEPVVKEPESITRFKAIASELRAPLPQFKTFIADFSAGRGEFAGALADSTTSAVLLCGSEAHKSVKIDRRGMLPLDFIRITADIRKLYPVLLETNWKCDLFCIRPSEDDDEVWNRDDLKALPPSSDAAMLLKECGNPKTVPVSIGLWLLALDRMTDRGDGLILMPKSEADALVMAPGAIYGAFSPLIWLVLDISAKLFDDKAGVEDEICAIYFAKEHNEGIQVHSPRIRTMGQLNAACQNAWTRRMSYRRGMSVIGSHLVNRNAGPVWEATRTEWNRRNGLSDRTDYHVWLDEKGVIRAQLTRFDQFVDDYGKLKSEAALFMQVIGRTPVDLILQNTSRQTLLSVIRNRRWRVDPELTRVVEAAISESEAIRSPLVPLPATQRMAWLDEVTEIKCTKSMGKFRAGMIYGIRSGSVLVERMTHKPNMAGEMEDILLNGSEMLLSIEGDDGKYHTFIDGRHLKPGVAITKQGAIADPVKPEFTLQQLVDHFEIPDVPDVAITKGDEYSRHRQEMLNIQQFINAHIDHKFFFRNFQHEDLSRAACHEGLVFGWDTGLGKGLAAIILCCLKGRVNWVASRLNKGIVPLHPSLIVAPGNLHDQLADEWKRRFGVKAIRLDCQDTYLALTNNGKTRLKPGFYLTSYHELGLNKVDKLMVPAQTKREFSSVATLMHQYGVTIDEAKACPFTGDIPEGSNPLLEKAIAMCDERYRHYSEGVGERNNSIKCVFSPSLADLCGSEFDCVVIDEGTRIKGKETKIGVAVRELNPKFRLVLTATAIKNRLKDIFYLLWWAAGGKADSHPRFPYGPDDQERFATDHLVCERNLTKEAKERKERGTTTVQPGNRRKKPHGKPGVEVCNIHRLWKIIAPTVLRRRKQDIGEDIVKKVKRVIRVPMGVKQHKVYEYHLKGQYLDCNGEPALMAKLQALRHVAACPNSEMLKQLPEAQEYPGATSHRSKSDYIPKLAACLSVIEQRMRLGEQSVVFSALHGPLDALSNRLNMAGIPHDVLDGRKSTRYRGDMSLEFQQGLPKAKPVLLAGMGAMAEGNNWPKANNVILIAFDWAWDLFEQSINRCHRLNSVKDVNVWSITCTGTTDLKLESMIEEKGDTSELVIDGKLIGEEVEEVSPSELLKIAEEEFTRAETYPELRLEMEWPALRSKLMEAWTICQGTRPMTPKEQMVQRAKSIPLGTLLERVKQLEVV